MRLILTLLLLAAAQAVFAAETFDLYVVRHAEKTTASDPALNLTGQVRARHLAQLLASSGIHTIWSSDYRRTRDTAAPVAQLLDRPVTLYDPRELSELAQQLRDQGQTALVVGHSNTTPQLVRLLGGQAEDMEEWQYDRVYQVRIKPAAVETTLLHLAPISERPKTD